MHAAARASSIRSTSSLNIQLTAHVLNNAEETDALATALSSIESRLSRRFNPANLVDPFETRAEHGPEQRKFLFAFLGVSAGNRYRLQSTPCPIMHFVIMVDTILLIASIEFIVTTRLGKETFRLFYVYVYSAG